MRAMFFRLFSGIVLAVCCAAVGAEPVVNGSFEDGDPGKIPDGWTYKPGNARSAFYIIDNIATDGRQALFIKNATSWKPNTYSSIFQEIPLKANVRYRLSCTLKGENVRKLGFVLGNRWNIRFYPKVTESWRKHEFEFTLQPQDIRDDKAMLRILTEDVTEGVWIDEVRIQPIGGTALSPAEFQPERVLTAKRLTVPLESLREIPAGFAGVTIPAGPQFYTGKTLPAAKDFQGKIALAYDKDGIIFLADVRKRNVLGGGGHSMWSFDSIQINISPACSFTEKTEPGEFEIGFSPGADKVLAYSWTLKRALAAEEADLYGGVTEGGYRIAARLKWEFFQNAGFQAADAFSFNAIINVNDGGIREVALLQPGIHDGKSKKHNTLVLFERERPTGFFKAVSRRNPTELAGTVYLSGIGEKEYWNMPVELTGNGRQEFMLSDMPPAGRDEIIVREIKLPLAHVVEGTFDIAFRAPGQVVSGGKAEKVDLLGRQLAELKQLRGRFDLARKSMEQEKLSHPFANMYIAVIERHLKLQEGYLTRKQSPEQREYYLNLGERVNRELFVAQDEFDALLGRLRAGEKIPAPPDGTPAFRAGYGHFTDAIRDIPFYQHVGANLMQFEIGPRDFLQKGENGAFVGDITAFRKKVEAALKKAVENNVKIALLLSPHYHPKWWLDEHPELKRGNGLTHYEVNAPEARRMVGAYLDFILPLLRDTPYRDALHSIVTTNEPNYAGANWSNPMTRSFFKEWCEKKYASIGKFNQETGLKFKSFAEIPEADPSGKPALNYEFEQFRRNSFADFHRFLADKVKEYLPDVPVHVKIMISTTYLPMGVDFAVDPELFTEFSDFNGNDAGMTYKRDRWISAWTSINLSHDLQYSLRPMPIMNTENHIIRDGEENLIPSEHVYTSILEQFLQGVGGIVTWVWVENTFERNRDAALRGSIYHRPANIVAHGRALADANRLEKPIKTYVNAKPRIAILYSPSSLIQNSDSWSNSFTGTYPEMCITGHKIGFISEKQLERGEFGEFRAIVATNATHISRGAAEGLSRFAARGGKLFAAGKAPESDSYGRPLQLKLPFQPAPAEWQGVLDGVSPLPVKLAAPAGNEGIFFRMVPDGSGYLVHIVNYNREPRKITLSGDGTFRDLLEEREFVPSLELPPLKPLLLRFYRQEPVATQ